MLQFNFNIVMQIRYSKGVTKHSCASTIIYIFQHYTHVVSCDFLRLNRVLLHILFPIFVFAFAAKQLRMITNFSMVAATPK